MIDLLLGGWLHDLVPQPGPKGGLRDRPSIIGGQKVVAISYIGLIVKHQRSARQGYYLDITGILCYTIGVRWERAWKTTQYVSNIKLCLQT